MEACGRRSVLRMAVALAAAAIGIYASILPSSAAGSPLAISVQIGYHGSLKLGQWMPVTVDLQNNGPDFEGTLEVQAANGSGGPPVGSAVYEAPVSLAAGATKHFRTYVSEDFAGPITVRVMQNGREVVSNTATSPNTFSGLLVGVLSDQLSTLDALGPLHPGGTAPIAVHLLGADLPDSAAVLRAFDVIAIDNFATDTLTAGQRTALDDYLMQGGALLLGTGGSWRKTLAGLSAAAVPMQVTGSTVLASAAALGGAPGVEIATGTLTRGANAWLGEGARPLLVEAPVGKGMVTMATFDWAQDSVAGWTGFNSMLRQVLVRLTYGNVSNPTSTGPAMTKFGSGTNASIATKGGALAQPLGNLPALDLPAWWLIGALVFVYVLLVGPVNYFVLRAIGRRALAWITVPAIALIASAGAYGTSVVTKGTSVLANEVSVIHVQPGSDRAYQEEYTGIMAPTRGDYEVVISSQRTLVSPIYYYSGVVGNNPNFAAMRVNTVNSAVTLPNMTAFTLRGFANEGILAHAPALSGTARMAGGLLVGSIQNSSGIEFTDGVVIAGNSFAKLNALRPGQVTQFTLTPATNSYNGPPISMTIYPSNYQFGGVGANNSSDTERDMETRSAILSTLIPNGFGGLLATTQPIVVLWTQQPFQNVTVNGAHPRTFVESAVVMALPIEQVGPGALPAGVVPGRVIDIDADTTQGPPGTVMAQAGSVTFSFTPILAPGTHLSLVSITNTNPFGAKGFLGPAGTPATIKAEAWDWKQSRWSEIAYQETGTTTVADSAVNSTTGEVRLRLSSTGQFAAGGLSLSGTVA